MSISPEYVVYLVGLYAGIWSAGFSIGKGVAWIRLISSVA